VGPDAATEETEKIMRNVDTDGNGYIDYSEFIAASMNRKKLLSKNNLNLAFQSFDVDGSGTITIDEIRAILGGVTDTTDEIWNQIIAEVDADGNGLIDLKEFKEMMVKLF
jgi:calcium-dependent protein kinase